MDVKEMEKNWPPAQKESPQPKYKSIFFSAEIQDDHEDWFGYLFAGDYYESYDRIRIVKAVVECSDMDPAIDSDAWQWILRTAVAEELGIEEDAVIFECKIEIK